MNSHFPHHNPIRDLTEVRRSPIHGLGIFSRVDIPAGTIWWLAQESDVLLIRQEQYEALLASEQSPVTEELLDAIATYSYFNADLDALVLILDNARYTNHCEAKPNSRPLTEPGLIGSVALRDIRAGEEICENYLAFDGCPWANFHEDI